MHNSEVIKEYDLELKIFCPCNETDLRTPEESATFIQADRLFPQAPEIFSVVKP
jgi:hypothetical protein